MKRWLLGSTLDELVEICNSLSLPSYTAKQVAAWIYDKGVTGIDQMSNLSKSARLVLSERFEVGGYSADEVQQSTDGTKKYLFPALTGTAVEAVTIPDAERATLCLSCQSGCKMGCSFCMTGRMGFKGSLTAGEIISQVMNVEESRELTNIVFMGMGEPLDNYNEVIKSTEILTAEWGFGWSPKRITVSSIGIIPALKSFLESSKCHLAISMHNPFDSERAEFMPMQKAYPISKVVELIRRYDFTGQRRVSFEYTMFSGWNDTKRHADAVVRLLKGLECRVNLIRFHEIPDFRYKTSPDFVIENFRERLNSAGILATIRASRGEDILAACGMLSSKQKSKEIEKRIERDERS